MFQPYRFAIIPLCQIIAASPDTADQTPNNSVNMEITSDFAKTKMTLSWHCEKSVKTDKNQLKLLNADG